MQKLDYAILFATKAHDGQRRKTDNVDMIFHPFTVGMLLQRVGADDDTVIAGILHDVVEDTKYTLDDIENIFGKNVRNIVDEVTEDKSLEWKKRKEEAIEKVRNASLQDFKKKEQRYGKTLINHILNKNGIIQKCIRQW